MSKSRKKHKSLSEQLADLSTPKPVTYHPDAEDHADLTAAKVCEYSEEDEQTRFTPKRAKLADEFADDPRYSGRPVSREDLDDSEEESIEDSDEESQELVSSEGLSEEEVQSDSETDQSELEGDGHMTDSDQSDSSVKDAQPKVNGISTISLESLKQDIAKGKAAKQQLSVWDGLLEARIKLHKVQGACNQLPQGECLDQFVEAGGEQVQESITEFRLELQGLMDDLLDLQQTLFLRNSETSYVVGGAGCHDNSDEEIPSDSEGTDDDGHTSKESGVGRKRQRPEWVGEDGTRDYEGYISRVHEAFQTYRDETIAKWNSKTRIAGGKVTNKSFIEVDQTVLSQIKHILADKPRLLKRTQLKRSVYRVLGTCEEEEPEIDQSDSSRDAHLKDYDEEIFDDDDFYHQLLRELIERKMDLTESSDPVAMGRQWLQLQRLRAKAKKKVDTRASKGRKIRYNIHPKLANFMVPIATGTMSDVSKNDLFSSLFGAHQYRTDSRT